MNKTSLDQYEEVVIDALKKCSAKLRKSFITALSINMMTRQEVATQIDEIKNESAIEIL